MPNEGDRMPVIRRDHNDEEREIVRRLADGEDPWAIDPDYGCTNPLTGYFPDAEVAAERAHRGAERAR